MRIRSRLSVGSEFLQPSDLFSRQRRFEAWARELIRLPRTGEGPLAQAAGITFSAIDKGEGEFACRLPDHPSVAAADVFTETFRLRPQAVLYAWPPPGQSLAPLFACESLRYLLVAGEPGGGVTGARKDWECPP